MAKGSEDGSAIVAPANDASADLSGAERESCVPSFATTVRTSAWCGVASAEGRLEAVVCLVQELGVPHSPVDRWGNTPLDDATRHDHRAVVKTVSVHVTINGVLYGRGINYSYYPL